jgi:sucrose-6-phosphate hydrolase SacC (GH32 family)
MLMESITCTTNVCDCHMRSIQTVFSRKADNPTANVAGNQHWGHATSKDLFTWANQQIAIFPGSAVEGVFSGSAIVDVNNTSGMFVCITLLRELPKQLTSHSQIRIME